MKTYLSKYRVILKSRGKLAKIGYQTNLYNEAIEYSFITDFEIEKIPKLVKLEYYKPIIKHIYKIGSK